MRRICLCLGLAIVSISMVAPTTSIARIYLRLTVTITDEEGDRLVPGLTKEDFEIFDGGIPQFIEYFSASPSPSSVAVVLDMNGSMQGLDLNDLLSRLIDICNASSVPDEVSLIGFAKSSQVIKDFVWRVQKINFEEVLGMLDKSNRYNENDLTGALQMAREEIQMKAKNHNRAIILISDAEENLSYATMQRVQKEFETMGLRVYGIFFPGKERFDHGRLHTLAVGSGGRYFRITDTSPIELLMRWILHELRYQYVIGFTPRSQQPVVGDNVSVHLSPNRLAPGISVRFTAAKAIGRTNSQVSEN